MRDHLSKKGGKNIKIKHRKIGASTLSAIAYRDGHGKIAMGISSAHRVVGRKHWDFHLKHADDRRKMLERYSFEWDVLETWIHNLNPKGKISPIFSALMLDAPIKAVTKCGSEDTSRFLGRALSFTSSTSDSIINMCLASMYKHGSSLFDTELVTSITPINSYMNRGAIPIVVECVSTADIDLLDIPSKKVRYSKMPKADLVALCITKLRGEKSFYTEKNKEVLVDMLSQHDPNAAEPDHMKELEMNIKKKIIGNSIMNPLSGNAKQSCSIGVQNECCLLHQLMTQDPTAYIFSLGPPMSNESMQGRLKQYCRVSVNEIYRPGMVMNRDKQYIKDSIDALGTVCVHGADGIVTNGVQLVGIELKTRTEDSTRLTEEEILSTTHEGHSFILLNYKYAYLFIRSNHELLQILHHATVYKLKLVLLLIGDKRSIIRGIWVKFDVTILSCYESLLSSLYDKTLSWAYNRNYNMSSILSSIEGCIPPTIGLEGMIDFIELWRAIFDDPCRLPIPQSTNIIPYHFSKWNKSKGGSNTITKLFWTAKHNPPNSCPSTNAIAQILRFLGVILFRCDAVMTSKEDLNKYRDLKNWREGTEYFSWM